MPISVLKVTKECLDFYLTLEQIRLRKKKSAKNSDLNPTGKKYTQDELADLGYPSFKAIQRGTRKHPPSREEILNLSKYLNATVVETNDLLRSAGCMVKGITADPNTQTEKLKFADSIIKRFTSLPAYVINERWDIVNYNEQVIKLFEIPDSIINLQMEHPKLVNILEFIFNPALGLKEKFDTEPGQWLVTARRNTVGFKLLNYLYTEDEWYKELINTLSLHPGFTEIWMESITSAQPFFSTKFRRSDGRIIEIVSVFSFFGDYLYPHLTTFYPGNKETEKIFIELGFMND